MSAADLLQQLHHHGCNVSVDGDDLNLTASQPLPPDLLLKLRNHKADVLTYLEARAARRREVLRMLVANAEITYAITTDDQAEADAVIVTLAKRDEATCDLRIPKAEYDGLAVLELIWLALS